MRRLWVFSDLHQDRPENAWDPAAHAPPGGFDVAVVAGDVHMPLTRAMDWLGERLPGVSVVYVPGTMISGGTAAIGAAVGVHRGRDRADHGA